MPIKYPYWTLFGILLGAFLLRIAALTYALPLDVMGDEFVHVFTAFTFLQDHTLRALAQQSYVPSLFAVLMTPFIGLFALGGIVTGAFAGLEGFKEFAAINSNYFMALGRFISALFGVGFLLVLFFFVKSIVSRRAAWIAIVLAALDFWLVHESQHGHLWMATTTFILLAIYFLVRLSETGATKNYLWSALSIALGFWMGYFPLILAPFLVLAHFHAPNRLHRKLFSSLLVLVILAGVVVWLNPKSIVGQFGHAIQSTFHVFGIQVLKQQVPALPYHEATVPLNNLLSLLSIALYDNPLLFVLGIAGLALMLYNRSWRNFTAQLLVGFPVLYLLIGMFVWSGPDARYSLPLLPSLIVGAAYAFDRLYSWAKVRAVGVQWGVSILLLLTLLYSGYTTMKYVWLVSRDDTRTEAREWVFAHIPSGSTIYMDTQYFDLPKSRAEIEFLAQHEPAALRSWDVGLYNGPNKNFPEPSYFALNKEYYDGLGAGAPAAQYLILGFNDPKDRPVVAATYTLVHTIYPRTPDKKMDDLVLAPMNPIVAVSNVDRLGPYVEIYARVK